MLNKFWFKLTGDEISVLNGAVKIIQYKKNILQAKAEQLNGKFDSNQFSILDF